MAIILNIETATERCSVAIGKDGKLLVEKTSEEQYSHAAKLTLLIEQCLTATQLELKDLDAIAISSGPGSYTGLRIGSSTAKGICYALNKPLIAVSTLHSLASASIKEETTAPAIYIPMIDARRMEVYAEAYNESGKITFSSRPLIIDKESFADLLQKGHSIFLSGNGSDKCKTVLEHPGIQYHQIYCSASHLIPLSEKAFQENHFVDLAYFSPSYLKKPNITTPKNIL